MCSVFIVIWLASEVTFQDKTRWSCQAQKWVSKWLLPIQSKAPLCPVPQPLTRSCEVFLKLPHLSGHMSVAMPIYLYSQGSL